MTNVKKICDKIGNDSFDALWGVVIERDSYKDEPEYHVMAIELDELLRKIPERSLQYDLESKVSDFTVVAMYQGFVSGFQEAVKLLTGGVNVT